MKHPQTRGLLTIEKNTFAGSRLRSNPVNRASIYRIRESQKLVPCRSNSQGFKSRSRKMTDSCTLRWCFVCTAYQISKRVTEVRRFAVNLFQVPGPNLRRHVLCRMCPVGGGGRQGGGGGQQTDPRNIQSVSPCHWVLYPEGSSHTNEDNASVCVSVVIQLYYNQINNLTD